LVSLDLRDESRSQGRLHPFKFVPRVSIVEDIFVGMLCG
jgi:hypothetical protein